MPDKGHENLIKDLETLLEEAKTFQFHDFKNTKNAMPKMEMVTKLDQIMNNVKEGKYDN